MTDNPSRVVIAVPIISGQLDLLALAASLVECPPIPPSTIDKKYMPKETDSENKANSCFSTVLATVAVNRINIPRVNKSERAVEAILLMVFFSKKHLELFSYDPLGNQRAP